MTFQNLIYLWILLFTLGKTEFDHKKAVSQGVFPHCPQRDHIAHLVILSQNPEQLSRSYLLLVGSQLPPQSSQIPHQTQ